MKSKLVTFILTVIITVSSTAQVSISTDGRDPDGSTMLDIHSDDRGLSIPNLDITDLSTAAPVTSPIEGLLAYNTNTTTGPGVVMWTGTKWVTLEIDGKNWSLKGNPDVDESSDFLGTTNSTDLIIKTNNQERMRVQDDGQIVINSSNPLFSSRYVYTETTNNNDAIMGVSTGGGTGIIGITQGNGFGVFGYSDGGNDAIKSFVKTGTDASGINVQHRGTSNHNAVHITSNNAHALYAQTSNGSKAGVYARNNDSDGIGVEGNSSSLGYQSFSYGVGVAGIGHHGVIGKGTDNTQGTGVIGIGNNGNNYSVFSTGSGGSFRGFNGILAIGTDADDGIGVIGLGQGMSTALVLNEGSGASFTGDTVGMFAATDASDGTGIIGLGGGASAYVKYPDGSGIAGTGDKCGVYGVAMGTSGAGIIGDDNGSATWAGQFLGPVKLGDNASQTHVFTGTFQANDNSSAILPAGNNQGTVGNNSTGWNAMYAYSFSTPSRRELKRDIVPVSQNDVAYAVVMNDIDNIEPSFYKYNSENDNLDPENPLSYRPNAHFGVLVDEAPDYVKDSKFSGIDLYALGTLALAGVKYNREEIKSLKKEINDFGTASISGNEVWINLPGKFRNAESTPVVTVTPLSPDASLYISEINSNGFRVKTNGTPNGRIQFNWIAMAKTSGGEPINNTEMENFKEDHDLVVSENTKEMVKDLKPVIKQTEEPNIFTPRKVKRIKINNITITEKKEEAPDTKDDELIKKYGEKHEKN